MKASKPKTGSNAVRRTSGQCRYDEVALLEKRLHRMMDEIPYAALGNRRKTHDALDSAETHLRDALAQLQIAWDEEVPRYNNSAAREVPS